MTIADPVGLTRPQTTGGDGLIEEPVVVSVEKCRLLGGQRVTDFLGHPRPGWGFT